MVNGDQSKDEKQEEENNNINDKDDQLNLCKMTLYKDFKIYLSNSLDDIFNS